jgi:hypothetical protein
VDNHRYSERLGHRIDRDVIVGRADPAGSEAIVIGPAKDLDCFDNPLLNVRNHANFGQPDALRVEPGRDLRDILVLGAAGQDFVADYGKPGGPNPGQNPRLHSTFGLSATI